MNKTDLTPGGLQSWFSGFLTPLRKDRVKRAPLAVNAPLSHEGAPTPIVHERFPLRNLHSPAT